MKYFIVNFKTYSTASGKNAVKLTEQMLAADIPDDVNLIVCPQAADIYRVREQFPEIEIWAQHVDLVAPGQSTGWTSIETLMMAGITGTLINHSEHELRYQEVVNTIQVCQEQQITSCVAVSDSMIADKLKEYQPDIIAYEAPELIGSGQSLIETDAANAAAFAASFQDQSEIKVCLGAGVSSKEDVRGAVELGYDGVLLASAITKSDNVTGKLTNLLTGFSENGNN